MDLRTPGLGAVGVGAAAALAGAQAGWDEIRFNGLG